jgi:general secretion pathway protein K
VVNLLKRKYDRGVALLATIVAIALMTLLVVNFTNSAALGYRSAANQADSLRARYLGRSGIAVGLAMLAQDERNDAGAPSTYHPYDSLDKAWAQPVPPIPVDSGTVSLSVVDEARKISVNNLFNTRAGAVDPIYEGILARLFTNIGVSTDLLPILEDWLDPDSVDSPGGAEADYYLRLNPPYEPRNGPMPTIGDVRMLKGMDDITFMRLSQFLTTMPEVGVNPNTAPAEVLGALTPELENNPQLVKEIITARAFKPFMQLTDLANLPGVGQYASNLTPLLTTRGSYFTITAAGGFAGTRQRIYATFRRGNNGTAMLMNWHED